MNGLSAMLGNGLYTLVAFIVALGLLIFVHEFGHYWVARRCGVKVLKFSIGFGPPLLRWTVGPDRTEWAISAIPLGGYVKMLGERGENDTALDPADEHRAFSKKSLTQRAAVVAAGPAANLLLAVLLYAILGWNGVREPAPIVDQPAAGTVAAAAGFERGDRVSEVEGRTIRSWNDLRLALLEPVIDRSRARVVVDRNGASVPLTVDASTLPDGDPAPDFLSGLGIRVAAGQVVVGSLSDGAARQAGVQTGDQILAADGKRVSRASDLIDVVKAAPERDVRILLKRGDSEITLAVVPQPVAGEGADAGRTIGRIGAALQDRVQMDTVRYGPVESIVRGAEQTWQMSIFTLRMLGKMVTGDLSLRNLSGPITIADLAGQSAKVGWIAYLSFLALISISLGVLNLLPIPVLDGGHLVYYGLEAIRGRPLSERFLEVTQKAGMALILMMMVVALFNDITRPFGP